MARAEGESLARVAPYGCQGFGVHCGGWWAAGGGREVGERGDQIWSYRIVLASLQKVNCTVLMVKQGEGSMYPDRKLWLVFGWWQWP